jgi:hypothetical protein
VKEVEELTREYAQEAKEQLEIIQELGGRLKDYILEYNEKIAGRDKEVKEVREESEKMRKEVKEVREELEMEKENLRQNIGEMEQIAEDRFDKIRQEFLEREWRLQKEVEERDKQIEALTRGRRRGSVQSSQGSDKKRYGSARGSRNKAIRSTQDSFTIEGRYPNRRIGEIAPPELDYIPNKESKHDKSIRSIRTKGPVSGNLRFRDQTYYEQTIINLQETIQKIREKNKKTECELKELRKINRVLELENKVAVATILNMNNSNGKQFNWNHNTAANQIINALQYIMDADNESTVKASETES